MIRKKKGKGDFFVYNGIHFVFTRVISYILVLTIMLGCIPMNCFYTSAAASSGVVTIYFVDNTQEKWIKNDKAVMELVDNTNGHIHYEMTSQDSVTWKVKVPESACNITFNRYDAEKNKQWNSWSAGGRGANNAYYADGSEYGHWDAVSEENEGYFHAGDVIYLDISGFSVWKQENAFLYVNFTAATKEENNGNDIRLPAPELSFYQPKVVDWEVKEHIYAYIITMEDEGATELRFWRGNNNTLWNCSALLNYEDYRNGKNCVKVRDWNNEGDSTVSRYTIDYEKDSDGDGLSDYHEILLGFDEKSIDSDNDGLTDAQEIYFTKSNPMKYDSLVSGTSDGEVDNDNDGLSNREEMILGTDPCNADSDEDGLTDGYEVSVSGSSPVNNDTDGDTLMDGDEIALGFSPLLPDTDDNGILDCDEKIYQNLNADISNREKTEVSRVAISFEGTGYINSTTSIEDLYGKDMFVSETAGLVGVPVEITSTSEFDTAIISFYLTEKDIVLSNLLILWYDEENDRYVEQETVVDERNRTVSAVVSHFSKYMIVDKTEWFEAWRMEIDYSGSSDSMYDTVIAIDCSGSMSRNDPNFEYIVKNSLYPGSAYSKITCYRKLAAENFVEAQRTNDRTGIVLFDSTAGVTCELTDSLPDLKSAIEKIYSSGGTGFNQAVSVSLDLLDAAGRDSEKMILLVSDGQSSINTSLIEAARAAGVVINTVYIGSASDNVLLRNIAAQTGGEYFKAVTAEQLVDIYNDIIINQKIDSCDSDQDGIPDIFEISGMKLSNGTVIYTDPFNPDTDNDGLPDGEEMNAVPAFWLNTVFDQFNIPVKVKAYIFEMKSNPNLKDSDGDGLLDGQPVMKGTEKIAPKDPEPMIVNGPAGLWKEQIRQVRSGSRVAHDLDSWYEFDPGFSWNILDWNWSEIFTGLGSRALMFRMDEEGIAVHSQFNTWQSIGGYNDLYDLIFHIGTAGNMDNEKFEFSCNGEDYVIWAWRGDYLNLGSGAEIGIYTNPHRLEIPYTPIGMDHWEVDKSCALSMKLYLYNYYSSTDIDNIFCWEPEEPQWWITGFNPDFDKPKVEDMISIGVIDFEEDMEMYNALKISVRGKNKKKYLIFDEDGHTVWFMWGA